MSPRVRERRRTVAAVAGLLFAVLAISAGMHFGPILSGVWL